LPRPEPAYPLSILNTKKVREKIKKKKKNKFRKLKTIINVLHEKRGGLKSITT